MSDRRRWAGQGGAVVLWAAITFLGLCLVGYDPTDPPSPAIIPPKLTVANPCGPAGAWLAHGLMSAVGQGAWVVLYAATIAVLLIVRQRRIPRLGPNWLVLA